MRPASLLHAAAAGCLACTAPLALAEPTIYRCDDGKGGVLYADAPCADGTRVDVVPGKADPQAIERLQREQQAFGQRHAAREAQRRAEAQAAREARLAEQPSASLGPGDAGPAYPGWAWGGVWPWPPVVSPPPGPPAQPRPPDRSAPFVPAVPGRFGLPAPPPAAPGQRPPGGSAPGTRPIR